MATSRPLTKSEHRKLLRHIRPRHSRNRALISAQLFLGFRISEVLALTIGHVRFDGHVRQRVELPPRFLKGRRGRTRSVPICHELRHALENYLMIRGRREDLIPTDPLFASPQRRSDGSRKPLRRTTAEKIIKQTLRRVCADPQGLSSHSLRKTWAEALYRTSGYNILMVREGLGHCSTAVTEKYLGISREGLDEAILAIDRSHKNPLKKRPLSKDQKAA